MFTFYKDQDSYTDCDLPTVLTKDDLAWMRGTSSGQGMQRWADALIFWVDVKQVQGCVRTLHPHRTPLLSKHVPPCVIVC